MKRGSSISGGKARRTNTTVTEAVETLVEQSRVGGRKQKASDMLHELLELLEVTDAIPCAVRSRGTARVPN